MLVDPNNWLAQRFNDSWQSQGSHPLPGGANTAMLLVIGGAIGAFWHVAWLGLCALGVLIGVNAVHQDLTRKLFALNDSLIAIDDKYRDEIRELNRLLYQKLGPFSARQ